MTRLESITGQSSPVVLSRATRWRSHCACCIHTTSSSMLTLVLVMGLTLPMLFPLLSIFIAELCQTIWYLRNSSSLQLKFKCSSTLESPWYPFQKSKVLQEQAPPRCPRSPLQENVPYFAQAYVCVVGINSEAISCMHHDVHGKHPKQMQKKIVPCKKVACNTFAKTYSNEAANFSCL